MASGADGDSLIPARGLLIGVRWGALAVAVSIGATLQLGVANGFAAAALAAVAIARTAQPVRLRVRNLGDITLVALETGVTIAAIVSTGGWVSPYLFCLAVTAVAVGYSYDLIVTLSVGLALVLAVTGLGAAFGTRAQPSDAVVGAGQVVLLFALAGYARRIFRVEEARVSLALDRVTKLTEANDLLFELHRVAQTLPVSLELGDTLTNTGNRIKELFQADVFAVLLRDEATGLWQVVAAEGTRAKGPFSDIELPQPARVALGQTRPCLVAELGDVGGLAFTSASGIYSSLRARGAVLGLIVVEHRSRDAFLERDARLLEGIGEQAALAIDNARMFQRLRTVGAHEERARIARDLHDRVGQSLAYLAFELDRLAGRATGTELSADLKSLRNDVRRAVSEVRETLYDLRSEVSEQRGITEVIGELLERVRERSGIEIHLDVSGSTRLPLPLERELLRIAQEAMANVERHAKAKRMDVNLRLGPDEAHLGITDDGVGFEKGQGGRIDSYGLLGMRERATAIGASLEIVSAPGRGTTVRCRVRQPEQEGLPA
jgi:signal transduction histidine kinase